MFNMPRRRRSSGSNRPKNGNERIVLYGLCAASAATYFLWTAAVPDGMAWWARLLIIIVVDGLLLTIVSWSITADLFIQLTREGRRMMESNDRKAVAMHAATQRTQRKLSDNQARIAIAQIGVQRTRLFLERQIAWSSLKLDQKLLLKEARELPQLEELDPYTDVEYKIVKK